MLSKRVLAIALIALAVASSAGVADAKKKKAKSTKEAVLAGECFVCVRAMRKGARAACWRRARGARGAGGGRRPWLLPRSAYASQWGARSHAFAARERALLPRRPSHHLPRCRAHFPSIDGAGDRGSRAGGVWGRRRVFRAMRVFSHL